MELKNNLRQWREGAGLTVEQLGKKVGTSGANISRIENGQQPRIELLNKIAQFFGKTRADFYSSDTGVELAPVPVGFRKVPVLDYVQAGLWAGVAPVFRDEEMTEFILISSECSDSTFALVLRGKSMLPEFDEGDRIIIDPALHPLPGDFVVAVNGGGEATFKQYRERGISSTGQTIFELHALNPSYSDIRSDQTPIRIVGTMREHHRLFRTR